MAELPPITAARSLSVSAADLEKIKAVLGKSKLAPKTGRHDFAEAYPSLAHCGWKFQQDGWLDRDLVAHVRWLGGHEGTSLLLSKLVAVPAPYDDSAKDAIRANPEGSWFALEAAHRLTLLMGAARLRPLVERHDLHDEYTYVHAKGPEETQSGGYRDTHFKLTEDPATVHPYKAIGPSLGSEIGHRLDAVCPDVVAYILIEKQRYFSNTGPQFFTLEAIEEELSKKQNGATILEYLRQRHFEIEPDFLPNLAEDLGFGGVSDVNLMGPREGVGRKYMRFDASRVLHDEDDERAGVVLNAFQDALKDIAKRQRVPLNWNRGDVLLVNNRRVATKWLSSKWKYHPPYDIRDRHRGDTVQSDAPLSPGDRVVLRMCFYSPVAIPLEPGQSKNKAK